MNAAVVRALPLLAATGHAHRRGGFIGLIIIVIVVVVGIVLLVKRHRDRQPLKDATNPPGERWTSPKLANKEETMLAWPDGLTGLPHGGGTMIEGRKLLPPGHYGLSGLLRSEWTKLRTVRSTMWTLGLTVLIGLVLAAVSCQAARTNWPTMSAASRASFDPIGESLIGVYFGQLTIAVLGVLVISAEYTTGTIRSTFSAAPRRLRVLTAKAIVFGIAALVASEIVAFTSFFLGQAFLTAPAVHATIGSPGALRAVAGAGLFLCVIGLIALGLATVIRNTTGAVTAVLGFLFLLPLIGQALPTSLDNDLARFWPLRIGAAMLSSRPLKNTFSPWTGLGLLCVYAALSLIVGAVLLVKRDA